MNLQSILQNPTVYEKHPEPEQASSIMLVLSFKPQIQGFLSNYTESAKRMKPQQSLEENLQKCACRTCFDVLKSVDLAENDHICIYNTHGLKCGYLKDLVEKGKKFRLPTNPEHEGIAGRVGKVHPVGEKI